MREALKEATLNRDEVPVGAIIVKDDRVIARAHNERESESKDIFGHAEMLAMKRASEVLQDRRLTDCTLYVTLEPCPMCAGAIMLSGLKMCVFGAYDQKQGCASSVYDLLNEENFSHRVQVVSGVLKEEASALLQAFFQHKRTKHL